MPDSDTNLSMSWDVTGLVKSIEDVSEYLRGLYKATQDQVNVFARMGKKGVEIYGTLKNIEVGGKILDASFKQVNDRLKVTETRLKGLKEEAKDTKDVLNALNRAQTAKANVLTQQVSPKDKRWTHDTFGQKTGWAPTKEELNNIANAKVAFQEAFKASGLSVAAGRKMWDDISKGVMTTSKKYQDFRNTAVALMNAQDKLNATARRQQEKDTEAYIKNEDKKSKQQQGLVLRKKKKIRLIGHGYMLLMSKNVELI